MFRKRFSRLFSPFTASPFELVQYSMVGFLSATAGSVLTIMVYRHFGLA